MSAMPQIVIFACVHNAGRSQMAAAFFDQLADPQKATARSAGTDPEPRVHPHVVAAMEEAGIDLGAATPRLLTQDLARGARWLITMGCGESCPVVPGARHADWPVADPKDQPLETVRRIRDDISGRVRDFVAAQGFGRS